MIRRGERAPFRRGLSPRVGRITDADDRPGESHDATMGAGVVTAAGGDGADVVSGKGAGSGNANGHGNGKGKNGG